MLVGRYAQVHSRRSSAGVGSLRLSIPIGHLYLCEYFHLGKPSLNDDPHSKPITKANGVVRRQLQAMAADDGRQTWDPLPYRSRNSFFSNWVLLFAIMLAMATNASLVQGLRFILAICLLMASWHFGVALVRRRPLSGLSEWGEAAIFSLVAGCAHLFVKLLG